MAKKRASLRGKDAEKNSPEEKGKGIDLLFGGTPEEEEVEPDGDATEPDEVVDVTFGAAKTGAESAEEDLPTEVRDDLGDLADDTFMAPPPPPIPPVPPVDTLASDEPDGEAVFTSSDRMVDELGLPVAMEAPPPDLEFATSIEESLPVAMEAPPADLEFAAPPTGLGPAFSAAEDFPADNFGEADHDSFGTAQEDLSGLAADDLSGLADENLGDVAAPELTPSPSFDMPMATTPLPSPLPAATAAEPTVPPVTPVPPPATTYPPPAAAVPPPPPLVTPTPSMAPPRARIDSIGGIVSERIQVAERDILPDDTRYSGGPISNVLAVTRRADIEQNELVAQRVARYIGRERREKLDREIENLYEEVAKELSVNKTDTEFALRTLSEAQDIIFEDARQYDEALYRVAIVKTMIARKRNLRRWSYTWGSAVFFYALVWLVAFITGFLLTDTIRTLLDAATSTSDAVLAVRAAWFSALAGGVGGVIGILYSLYWHVAMKQDFDRQYVMYYFVQPVMGFVLGAVVYFIIGAGFLLINFASDPSSDAGRVLSSGTVIALQLIFGWIAGFRQRFVFEMIDKIVQRLAPEKEGDESKEPVSVIPADQLGHVPPSTRNN